MIILAIVEFLLILVFAGLYLIVRRNNRDLIKSFMGRLQRMLEDWDEDRRAWDQGREEAVQGLEQELLTASELNEALRERIDGLQKDLAECQQAGLEMQMTINTHEKECLPRM